MINIKICDVTDWAANNYDTHISQYLRGKGNKTMKFDQLIKYNMRNIFPEKSSTKFGGEASPGPFIKNQN